MKHAAITQILKKKKRSSFPEDDGSIIGFKNNSYYLNDPINTDKLKGLEIFFSIEFPEEYRSFISKIGNGGAGPAYGFYSLEMSLTELIRRYMYDEELGITLDNYLSAHFQLPENRDWNAPGMIPICNFGCSRYDFIILSGKERGNIWTYVENVGFFPKESQAYNKKAQSLYTDKWLSGLLSPQNTYRLGFNDWYQLWLEEN